MISKDKLGFTEENIKKFDDLLNNPHGVILITGPTGSGKSTTLYAMLGELNKVSENIITVEDPVEYSMPGINQVQVNTKAGLTFSSGLRSILRQDPDIIMIGEIRDQETVDIAIRAAITGHLVLSTIHTNDAPGTISRLVDMGVPSYMLAASLVGILSQRLVKKICPFCKMAYTPSKFELRAAGLPASYSKPIHIGKGCTYCNNTGYKGRMAVHEILVVDRAGARHDHERHQRRRHPRLCDQAAEDDHHRSGMHRAHGEGRNHHPGSDPRRVYIQRRQRNEHDIPARKGNDPRRVRRAHHRRTSAHGARQRYAPADCRF